MIRYLAAGVALVLMTACNKSEAPTEAGQLAAALTGDAKGAADANPVCKLFDGEEMSQYSGGKLAAGTNAAMGCQWASQDGNGMTMISVVPMRDADSPRGAPGYRELPELGEKGYVAEDMGGWIAAASQGEEFVKVVVTGPHASDKAAIALVQETLKRRH